MARGIAGASALPEDTVELMLGAVADTTGTRAIGNLDINLGRDVFAFASGEFANSGDWSAATGLKVRW